VTTAATLQELASRQYKYGFVTDIDADAVGQPVADGCRMRAGAKSTVAGKAMPSPPWIRERESCTAAVPAAWAGLGV